VSRTHYEVTRPGAPPVDEALTEKVERALGEGKSQVVAPEDEMEPTGSAVVAPSLLRGALVGGVTVYDDSGEREWTEDEIALMEVVAERMAIIAENMRLLDETQRRAAREQLTGEVTARMRESLDMETVLRTAVQDIREVMDLPAVTVRLTNPPEDEDDGGAGSEA
jgi:GAF domain-containing protein